MLNLFFCGHFYLRLLRDSPGWGKDPLRGFNEHDLSSSSRVKSGNFLKLADRLTASQMFSTQETKRQLVAHGDDSSIANCRTKPSQYFLECMEFFAVFKYCYIFIPRFLARTLIFRHRASCILGQAFRYSPENAFYIFNQQIYFIIWYLLDRASLI